ncbi:hypothetical protein PUN28_019227 [Cardiocondyla obscurior]|uniref:Uncharacterized protein n=1 Tax=Cardiocondyla obscurior TaxID=286306 RepID=A0AAW2EEE1_9HYME
MADTYINIFRENVHRYILVIQEHRSYGVQVRHAAVALTRKIVITQIKRMETLDHCTSLAIVSVSPFLFFFLFATYLCIDGAFCRFVEHVRNVNYQNVTRNDRQIKKKNSSGHDFLTAKGVNVVRAEERRRWR